MSVETNVKGHSFEERARRGSATYTETFKRRNCEREIREHPARTDRASWDGCGRQSADSKRDQGNRAIRVCRRWQDTPRRQLYGKSLCGRQVRRVDPEQLWKPDQC